MKVFWTKLALSHLDSIYDYIAHNSKFYARKTVGSLIYASEQIAHFPYSGKMVREFRMKTIREIVIKPYRVIYRVKSKSIDVLGVIHGAQRLKLNLKIRKSKVRYHA